MAIKGILSNWSQSDICPKVLLTTWTERNKRIYWSTYIMSSICLTFCSMLVALFLYMPLQWHLNTLWLQMEQIRWSLLQVKIFKGGFKASSQNGHIGMRESRGPGATGGAAATLSVVLPSFFSRYSLTRMVQSVLPYSLPTFSAFNPP